VWEECAWTRSPNNSSWPPWPALLPSGSWPGLVAPQATGLCRAINPGWVARLLLVPGPDVCGMR